MIETKLGVLGLGSRSTLYYLSELNRLYNQVKGAYSTCPLVLLNTDFNAINSLLPNTSKELDAVLESYIHELETFDAQQLLIPNITLHETIDRLSITKNVLHPVPLSIKKMKENNWTKVVLFGSLFSMSTSYIKDPFVANGVEVILPSPEDMLFIDMVRKQIYSETETSELIEKYHRIIHKYTAKHPVILSCTELSILKPKGNKNLLDMADVQIEEAIKYCIA
ncbi:aspartate/glutamate racemase family protein [Lacinutrix himadriensis]|uniref:aspartate/glutamate racemase family protein n=1 Tax=Lacinutrix himadriensis TaxID=641549 RepID=UPI0006E152B4|nr:aspartate/glutamate racemase family protein [Lacinutrix himadriensis]